MTNTDKYKGFQIISNSNWNHEINGFSLTVTVYGLNPKDDKDFVFIEKFQITTVAIKMRHGDFETEKVENEIIEKTRAKIVTRIDFGLFDKGNEYLQTISSENLDEIFIPIDDESIQNYLLKGLLNLRKSNPSGYLF